MRTAGSAAGTSRVSSRRGSMGCGRGGFGRGSSGLFGVSCAQHQAAEEPQDDGPKEKSGPDNVAKSKHFHLKNSSILFQ
jgi:hypothetical protein